MTTELLPPHDDIDLALEDIGAAGGASSVHGLLSGLACGGHGLPEAKLRALLADELDADLDDVTFRELRRLDEITRRQLADDELGFELLLPEDDRPLAERVAGMAEWCEGFLGGFGTASAGRHDRDLPEDVRMLLDTIGEFTRAEVGDDTDGDDEAERNYMELVEYLRIAALTIYMEIVQPRDGGPGAEAPVH
ncbi:MAG: UPF0149 family protein [Pseudomonadota bacterium]